MTVSIERTEYLVPESAEALAGLLGVALPDIETGGGLPLLWHWVYLLERSANAVIGRDGHPMVGGLPSPPGPDQRRMFAGGRVTSHAPLRVGRLATRRSAVLGSTDKQGSSGRYNS